MFACPDCECKFEWWDSLLEHYYWTHGTKLTSQKKDPEKLDKKQNKDSKDK